MPPGREHFVPPGPEALLGSPGWDPAGTLAPRRPFPAGSLERGTALGRRTMRGPEPGPEATMEGDVLDTLEALGWVVLGPPFPRKRKLSLRLAASVSSPWAFAELLPLGAGLRPCLAASGADRVKREAGEKSAWGVEQARRAGALGPFFRTPCLGTPQPGPAAKARRGPAGRTPLGNCCPAGAIIVDAPGAGRGAGSRSAAVDCCLLPCTTCGLIRARERISCFLYPRKGF